MMMTIFQDRKIARAIARLKGVAQKGRMAVWTSEARLNGEGNGCPESHGGAT